MRITESQLRKIIKQEVRSLREAYPPISDNVRARAYGVREPMDPVDLMGDLEVALDNRENPAEIADFMRAEGLTANDVRTANLGLYRRLDAVGVFDILRSLHEGPGKKDKKGSALGAAEVARGSLLGTQTEVNIDGALSQWRRLVAVTNAEQDLKRAQASAKGLTHAKVEAALGDAVGSMLGRGMTGEDIVNYIENRAYEMDFREEDARDIARAARSRLQAANIY